MLSYTWHKASAEDIRSASRQCQQNLFSKGHVKALQKLNYAMNKSFLNHLQKTTHPVIASRK